MESKLLKCQVKQPIPVPPPKIDETHVRSITSDVTSKIYAFECHFVFVLSLATDSSSLSILPNQPVSIIVKSAKVTRPLDVAQDAQNSSNPFEEIFQHEPDIKKQPKRSALKGGRLAEKKRLIEQKHSEVVAATKNEKTKPKVAPKPKPFNVSKISSDNKENLIPRLTNIPFDQDEKITSNGRK